MDYTKEQIKVAAEACCYGDQCECPNGNICPLCVSDCTQLLAARLLALESENADLKKQLAESEKRERAANIILQTEDESGVPYEFEHYLCPGCRNVLVQRYKGSKAPLHTFEYCPGCGQHLEWRGVSEKGE